MIISRKIILISGLFFSVLFASANHVFSWDSYDSVAAVVNNRPIMQSEVTLRFERLRGTKKISSGRYSAEKSRILDRLIENEIVFETAQKESIEISNKRVINQLEGFMTNFFSSKGSKKEISATVERVSLNLEKYLENRFEPKVKIDPDLQKFIDHIEKKERTDFFTFFDDLRVKIAKEQIMSVAVGANPPSTQEARKWYNANKSKLGYEVHVKHILIIPDGRSLSEEKKANKKIEGIRKRIMAGESFEALAAQYSQDPGSASNGGDLGWQILAQLDPYFAGNVFRMSKRGQISQVFKSGFGYHIAKYIDRRAVTFDRVEKMITYKLYTENMESQFKKWVEQRKKESAIKIYMEDYVKVK
ncbi:MAG TPA: peptidylprolyl isomerase [Spirochaetota bacterium]|nr:peptidylprolyl isomerase [Spirochaetota bacterium]HPF05989.1 peptidylprolyl isomerase [Spirochaetota bacterium]HPJ42613.1 peptidylprolyl isomerase [Spirochaetota bacterium]HPR37353.1 peptidylprolyl isomerase [Spirochaetota bacterium]HRX47192.1 peptidylprolyl isomerase [Spirochaetota bacterium]